MNTKQLVITGATSGIGKATVMALAKQDFQILLIARNKGKSLLLIDALKEINPKGHFEFVECDLSSLKSVDAAAHIVKSKIAQIDVLINNAGGIFSSKQQSVDGHELTFAMNHLGPFLLTEKLSEILVKGSRIINVSSAAHPQALLNVNDLQLQEQWSSIAAYGNAKLFNIYSAQYWHKMLNSKGISTFSLHPGVVNTGFGNDFKGIIKLLFTLVKPLMLSPEKGAETSIFLATEPNIEKYSGLYFAKKKVAKTSALAQDSEKRDAVIAQSFELIKNYL